MTSTTLAPSAAFRGGMRLFGQRPGRKDLLALLALLLASCAGLMLVYVRAPAFAANVPGDYDQQHLQAFHEPEALASEDTPSYRWTGERSTVVAPGLGRGTWAATLTLASPQPEGQPKQALIDLNGQQLPVQLTDKLRVYHMVGASSGDLRMTIAAQAGRYGEDPRLLGVVFKGADFQPVAVSSLPPARMLMHTLLALTLAFLTLRLIGIRPGPALLGPLAGLVLLAWGLIAIRPPLGLYSVRVLALTMLGLLLIAVVRWAAPRLFRLGGVMVEPAALT
ncbi:MAG TPA: hypothetical protein VLA19_11565, partial [Herpetosiphonaceae bacterium]|nr:hypothetical protein [Herpetosiphonaceae bacterium]